MIAALSRVNMALRPASKIFFRFASLQDSNLLNASLDYQKAVLAENIIKIIRQKPKQYNESRSLKDNITLMINDSKTSPQAKESFNNLFRDGQSINTTIFSQVRITEGSDENNKLVFNPTYLTAGQVFNAVLKSKGLNRMEGHFGISKTFSIVLLSILTNMIVCYKIKNPLQKIAQQLMVVPKILYWNIDVDIYQKPKIIKKLIKQCQQIQKQIQDRQDLDIQQIYLKYGIYMIMMGDQINSLLSWFRQRQTFQEKVRLELFTENDRMRQKKNQQSYKIQIEQKIKQAKQIIKTLNKLAPQFVSVILLSSTCLQTNFLQSEQILKEAKHAGEIHPIEIKYGLKLNEKESVMDVIDCFIFEFGERIKLSKLAQRWLNETDEAALQIKSYIRNSIYQHIQKQLKMQFFTNPLYIREYIVKNIENILKNWKDVNLPNTKSQQSKQALIQKQKILKEKIIQLFDKILEYSDGKFKEKVDKFIRKDNNYSRQIRIGILSLLYDQALALNEKTAKNNTTIQKITFPKIATRQLPQYLVQPVKVKQDIKNHLERNILQANKDYTQIQLMFSSKLIISIMQYIKGQFILYWYMNWHLLINRAKSQKLKGQVFELSFLEVLRADDIDLVIKKNSWQQDDYLRIPKISSKQLRFSKWPTPNQLICKEGGTYSLQKAMQNALNYMISNDIQNAFCLPQTQNQVLTLSNPSIDFIIASINIVTKEIILNAFDITMEQISSQTKIKKFLERYQTLEDKEITQILTIQNVNYSIQLRYYVLGMTQKKTNWDQIFTQFMPQNNNNKYKHEKKHYLSKEQIKKKVGNQLYKKSKAYVKSFSIKKGENTKDPLLKTIGQISLDGVELSGNSPQFKKALEKFLNMMSTIKQQRHKNKVTKKVIKKQQDQKAKIKQIEDDE